MKYKEWKSVRKLNADGYICYISIHCEHITLEEPYKSSFYAGIRKAIMETGDETVITDTIPLYLVQKPLPHNPLSPMPTMRPLRILTENEEWEATTKRFIAECRNLPAAFFNLRTDFHSIAEDEHQPAVRIDRCIIHKPAKIITEALYIYLHSCFIAKYPISTVHT